MKIRELLQNIFREKTNETKDKMKKKKKMEKEQNGV